MAGIPKIGKGRTRGGRWPWLLLLLAGAGVAVWVKQRGAAMLGAGRGDAGVTTWQPTPRADTMAPPPDLAERQGQAMPSAETAAGPEVPDPTDAAESAAAAALRVTSGAADPGEDRPEAEGGPSDEELAERASDRGATLGEDDAWGGAIGIARRDEPEVEGAATLEEGDAAGSDAESDAGDDASGDDAGPVVVDDAPAGFAALDERGFVEGDGTMECPEGYPIKGNATSRIFHRLGEPNYGATKPDFCFATEEDAVTAGYRERAK